MAAARPHREERRKNTQAKDFRPDPKPPPAAAGPPGDPGPWPDEELGQPLFDDDSRMWSFVFEDDLERD